MGYRDVKGANAVGKMTQIDLLNAGLPKTLQCVETAVSEGQQSKAQ